MRETGRIGVDIGGTFTDIVLFTDTGRTYRKKDPVDARSIPSRRS